MIEQTFASSRDQLDPTRAAVDAIPVRHDSRGHKTLRGNVNHSKIPAPLEVESRRLSGHIHTAPRCNVDYNNPCATTAMLPAWFHASLGSSWRSTRRIRLLTVIPNTCFANQRLCPHPANREHWRAIPGPHAGPNKGYTMQNDPMKSGDAMLALSRGHEERAKQHARTALILESSVLLLGLLNGIPQVRGWLSAPAALLAVGAFLVREQSNAPRVGARFLRWLAMRAHATEVSPQESLASILELYDESAQRLGRTLPSPDLESYFAGGSNFQPGAARYRYDLAYSAFFSARLTALQLRLWSTIVLLSTIVLAGTLYLMAVARPSSAVSTLVLDALLLGAALSVYLQMWAILLGLRNARSAYERVWRGAVHANEISDIQAMTVYYELTRVMAPWVPSILYKKHRNKVDNEWTTATTELLHIHK